VDILACFLSVVTLHELQTGILCIARRDAVQGERFGVWIERKVIPRFAGRILPVNEVVALRCAALHVPDPRPAHDAMIAATALVHEMTVVTGNSADFAQMGVALVDPLQAPMR
jgi:predicted nucleic acid-binding protein